MGNVTMTEEQLAKLIAGLTGQVVATPAPAKEVKAKTKAAPKAKAKKAAPKAKKEEADPGDKTSKPNEVKQKIVAEIIESLKETKSIWHKDWKAMGVPLNPSSHTNYKGINFLLLTLKQMAKGYTQNKWMTISQIGKLGGQITKGEKSTIVHYYKRIDKEDNSMFFLHRYYLVFNIDQTSLKDDERFQPDLTKLNPKLKNKEVEKAINDFSGKCKIEEIVQDKACYIPAMDKIIMPAKEQFSNYHAFYATLLHEIAHATGHTSRLDRMAKEKEMFSDSKEQYAFEELVAEITSMFVLATYRVDNEAIKNNSIAYIDGWIKNLESNPDYIFKASRFSQQAFEYITGIKTEYKAKEKEEASAV